MLTHRLPTTKAETFVLSYRYDFGMTSHDDISIFLSVAADSLCAPCAKLCGLGGQAGWKWKSVGGSCADILTGNQLNSA